MRAIEIWSGFESALREDTPPHRAKKRQKVAIISEFACTKLIRPFLEGDVFLPVGAKGTVLSVFPKTQTYTIEFFEPRRCVETVPMNIVAELNAQAT